MSGDISAESSPRSDQSADKSGDSGISGDHAHSDHRIDSPSRHHVSIYKIKTSRHHRHIFFHFHQLSVLLRRKTQVQQRGHHNKTLVTAVRMEQVVELPY